MIERWEDKEERGGGWVEASKEGGKEGQEQQARDGLIERGSELKKKIAGKGEERWREERGKR